jgi:hypothetical protein
MRHDLPSWHAEYDQAQRWLRAGCFESLVHDLRSVLRLASRRVARTFYPRHLGRPRFWPHGRPIAAAVASEMALIFKPSMLHDAATLWRSAIEDLSPHAPPRRYLTPARCALMREAAIDFCDLLGAEAHALGWTAAELFALHPEYGTVRIEVCWVMISGNRAQAVELSRVGFSVVRPTAPSRVRSEVSRSGRSLRARAAQPCTRIGPIRARSRSRRTVA